MIFTVSDATILILAYGRKDSWSHFVRNSMTDLFSITTNEVHTTSSAINSVISRIKQGRCQMVHLYSYNRFFYQFNKIYHIFTVPQRLINTQCGSNYVSRGDSHSFDAYIEPATIVSYRMHPNYFFSTDTSRSSTIKVRIYNLFYIY